MAVKSTGGIAEERETVPISRRPKAERRVAISMSPEEIPTLRRGDRLRITAELETTNNCRHPGPLCVSRPYSFSPRVGLQLILAHRAGATHGAGTMALTGRREIVCRQPEPHREHHCVTVFTGTNLRLTKGEELPCRLRNCLINLVVDASNSEARRGDVILLGIDRPDGTVHQGRGRINVTRFRGPAVEPRTPATDRRLRGRVDVDEGAKKVLYSLRLRKLERDEQLTFEASTVVGIKHLPYDTFVGSQLVLTERPGAVSPTRLTRRVAAFPRDINKMTGFNCTALTTPCKLPRVGTLVMRGTPRRDGRSVPLYVNYVFRNAPKRAEDRPGDAIKIRRGGGIEAKRYPADARG